MKRALFVLSALLVYGMVVDARQDDNPYSHAHQEAFVAGCEHSGSSEPMCRCMFDWIKQNVTPADYKAYGHLVTSPGYTASQTPAWLLQATTTCLAEVNGGARA